MSDENDEPRSKEDVLSLMAAARERLEATIAGLDEAALTRAEEDGWSVKDHLAHLTAWERGLTALLRRESRPAAMGLDPALWQARHEREEAINAHLHGLAKDKSLAEVLADRRESRAELLAVLDGLTFDDLMKPYADYAPDDSAASQDPVGYWVAGNAYGHEDEHRAWIARLVDESVVGSR